MKLLILLAFYKLLKSTELILIKRKWYLFERNLFHLSQKSYEYLDSFEMIGEHTNIKKKQLCRINNLFLFLRQLKSVFDDSVITKKALFSNYKKLKG